MARTEITHKLPEINLTEMRGWENLKSAEQAIVRRETDELLRSIAMVGNGRLAIGKHLQEISNVLTPRRLFEKYLRLEGLRMFNISRVTAFRFIKLYQVSQTYMPAPALRVALMRPNQMLDADLIKATPPPKSSDPEIIDKYLESVSKPPRGKVQIGMSDERVRKGECIYFLRVQLKKIAPHRRAAAAKEIAGYLLTLAGHASSITVHPLAIPDEFQLKKRGPKGPRYTD